MSTNTAVMATRMTAGSKKPSLGRRIADYFNGTFTEYQAEIICGMLSLTGHTNVYRTYQMLKG